MSIESRTTLIFIALRNVMTLLLAEMPARAIGAHVLSGVILALDFVTKMSITHTDVDAYNEVVTFAAESDDPLYVWMGVISTQLRTLEVDVNAAKNEFNRKHMSN